MNIKVLTSNLLPCLLILLSATPSVAQDWPGWRGPARDGIVKSFSAPKRWPERLKPKWKVQVGSGHSSPVVVGKRVFLHSRQGNNESVSCFDLETGKVEWQDHYPASYSMNPAAVAHGKGPKSTPVVHNGRLYTLGISGILSSYDVNNGKLRWRKEFSGQFKATSPLYGTSTSPIVHGGLLIVHVGGNDSGALIAYDEVTGDVRWSWAEDGPGYASPIVAELGGVSQLVTQTQKFIVSIAPATGRLLWRLPFETEYAQNIVTPVVYKQTLIFSGLDKGTTAVRVNNRGNKWETEPVWHNDQVSMYMSTPVVNGDYLFGLSHKRKGQFFCLDARNGKTLWVSNGREGDNAAVLSTDDLQFFLTDGAELTVARTDTSQFSLIKKYSVADSPTWAHPILSGNRILIRDATSLALLSID
jgi:outer membrane protein assembly factor BamB